MEHDRQFITALARGFDILACFGERRHTLCNRELARLTGLPRSSVSRLCHTLVKLGYLDYDSEQGHYRLALRIFALQPAALAGAGVTEVIGPHLRELAKRIGESSMLTVYDDYSLVAVRCDSGNPSIDTSRFVGWRYPMRGTAMGRAYLASSGRTERERIVDHLLHEPFARAAEVMEEVEEAIRCYRSEGYCVALGVARPGVHSISTTVQLRSLGRRVAVTCGGPAHRLPLRVLREKVAPALMECTGAIERAVQVHERVRSPMAAH